jgi:hypothetical protein
MSDTELNLELSAQTDGVYYNLCLTAPQFIERKQATIVAIIDISGSMNTVVGLAEGEKGFTRLDLVKHVLNVLVTSLNESDHLCLLTFSDETEIVFEISKMDVENKEIARKKIKNLQTQGGTYTKGAIEKAYKIIADSPKNSIQSILLLTDGEDNDGVDIVKNHFNGIKKPTGVQFNTFGFSSNIWSHLLEDLALQGGGIFGYIPDQTMIGTVFINFLANTFLTYKQGVYIQIEDTDFEFVFPGQRKKISINFGQSKNFLLKKREVKSALLKKTVSLKLGTNKENLRELTTDKIHDNFDLSNQIARNKMMQFCFDTKLPSVSVKEYENSTAIAYLESFLSEFKEIDPSDKNQAQMKLSIDFWDTWGQHYIRSFKFSHLNEQCLNFKAPSMQIYKTAEFESICGKLTDLFCDLEPPEPTGYYYGNTANVTRINNMNTLMDVHGGCILETCKIKLQSGLYKPIGELRKGEVLSNGAKVLCLVKSLYDKPLIKIGKLKITAYHPIFYDDQWIFPIDLLNEKNIAISVINPENSTYVCNLVLDKDHIIDVEGIKCITLAHGYENGILKHPYYGTKSVVNEYSKLYGWSDGIVTLKQYSCIKDENGLICSTTVHD